MGTYGIHQTGTVLPVLRRQAAVFSPTLEPVSLSNLRRVREGDSDPEGDCPAAL